MAYRQARDVLARAKKFHDELRSYYEFMSEMAESERVKLLLDYMSEHERRLESCVEQVKAAAEEGVLDTWFKNPPETAPPAAIDDIAILPEMDVSEVITTAVQFDDYLLDVYRRMIALAQTEDVRATFQQLLDIEKREELRMVRDTIEIDDT